MKFSIIIPAYNAEAYLQRCLDSIFSQDFQDYEVIVIDDGSSDGTPTLLTQYPSVNVITQANQGMATARNRGLDVARGEYILFVDSDDWLCPDALRTLAERLHDEDILGFGTQIHTEANGATAESLQPATPTLLSGWEYFNRYRLKPTPVHFVCIWQRAYRRAFLEEKKLRFEEGLRRAEDDLFTTLAMLHAHNVRNVDAVLYTYRLRQGSITRCSDPRLDADSRRVQQILADTFIPRQDIDKTAIYQVLASNYINILSHKGEALTVAEWHNFQEVCTTPRHRRLYRLLRLSPALYRAYNHLCSSLR